LPTEIPGLMIARWPIQTSLPIVTGCIFVAPYWLIGISVL